MSPIISEPIEIMAQGNLPKRIQEFIGRINTQTETVSIARMISPENWIEPGQKPEFDEYSLVLKGILQVQTTADTVQVKAGQAFFAPQGEWVKYSTPLAGGAEYLAVCLPAFSPETVHRDEG